MIPARVRLIGLGLLLATALVLPLTMGNLYLLGVVISAYITAIGVYGLNILVGYTGQLSLAHGGFFGIGGYATSLLMVKLGLSFWLALPLGLAITCAIGFLAGMVALRTRGSYFAIFTLALGVIITIVLQRWESLTGGTDGLIGVPAPSSIGPLHFESMRGLYYLVLAFLILTIYFSRSLVHSLVGRSLLAIRNSEDLARTIGIDVARTQRLSFTISVGFAGLAGALYATYLGSIGPGMSSMAMTFNMLLFLMLGGVGSLAGPIVGTLLITALMQTLQSFEHYQHVILGPLLIIIMIFFPNGLVGIWGAFEHRWRTRRLKLEPAATRVSAPRMDEIREPVHAASGRESRH
jgi:branched-chain amino acid transport system permease protein